MATDVPPLTSGAIIGGVISNVSAIAGEIVVNIAAAIDGFYDDEIIAEDVADTIDHVADLFSQITDLIGESLVPIYDVSYLSLSIIYNTPSENLKSNIL